MDAVRGGGDVELEFRGCRENKQKAIVIEWIADRVSNMYKELQEQQRDKCDKAIENSCRLQCGVEGWFEVGVDAKTGNYDNRRSHLH